MKIKQIPELAEIPSTLEESKLPKLNSGLQSAVKKFITERAKLIEALRHV